MAFDQSTRNRLQRFVNDARSLLDEEFTRQLQNDYGMDPKSGEVAELAKLRHLDDARGDRPDPARHAGALPARPSRRGADAEAQVLDRIVREQAFTVLNRLAALRMAEARGLLIESVGNGYQAKGFQLYARLAGTGLGETGDAYRIYLFSVFDELAARPARPVRPLLAAGPAVPARGGAAAGAGADQRRRDRAAVGRGRDHRLDLPVLQLQGRAQGDARCQPGAAQQPRAGGAQPVLHAALRGGVPGRQHAGAALVQRDRRADRPARALPVPAGEARRGARRRPPSCATRAP